MKTIIKTIISGIVGTTFMTLYSYIKSKNENEDYLEPRLLNKLIDNSKKLPHVENTKTYPVGWIFHYGTGICFVSMYRLFWKRMFKHLRFIHMIVTGSISGFVGILIWFFLLSNHTRPPENNRKGYYRQLFIAHIVFSFFAIISSRVLEETARKNTYFTKDEKTD